MVKRQQDNVESLDELVRGLAERVQQQAVRPNIHGYSPHNKQVEFHSSDKRHRLYIGGNRSGKTTGGITEDIWWATSRHPYRTTPDKGIRGRIVGVDFLNGIEKILLPEFKRWCPLSDLRGGTWYDAWSASERTVYFENGSFIEFMSYDQDVDKFAGTSRHFIHFDEEPPKEIFTECTARLIDTKGSWWMTLTPVQGMQWMYDDIYLVGKETASNIDVIEVDMTDNPHLDPEEIELFLATLSAEEVESRVHGKFVRRGGLIFKTFDAKLGGDHVIPRIDKIDPTWRIYVSMDHGFNNPSAWLWHAVDGDGNVITFAEHYKSEMIVEEHARVVKNINKQFKIIPEMYIGDPSIAQRSALKQGASIQTEYALNDIYIMPGNNEVFNGVNKLNSYLKRKRWKITENCPNLIWEMQRYRWKTWANKTSQFDNNPYDQPHKKDDHACDSSRYFFTIMPDLAPIQPNESEFKIPVNSASGRDPYQPRYDDQLVPQKQVSEWSTEYADEYMGGEW